jgi:hypothetical protein
MQQCQDPQEFASLLEQQRESLADLKQQAAELSRIQMEPPVGMRPVEAKIWRQAVKLYVTNDVLFIQELTGGIQPEFKEDEAGDQACDQADQAFLHSLVKLRCWLLTPFVVLRAIRCCIMLRGCFHWYTSQLASDKAYELMKSPHLQDFTFLLMEAVMDEVNKH